MNIGFIGMGFVGGTTAKVLGEKHNILPYDKFKEPYNKVENFEKLARDAEVVFVAVPTPMKHSGEMDYSAIFNSLDNLKVYTSKYNTNPYVIIRSTAVSGTTDSLEKKYPYKFGFNPEFLREKNAFEDMKNTNRIIIGSNYPEVQEKVKLLYMEIFPNVKYILTDNKTAEMIKYSANVTLASQVAIANELYQICQKMDIDYNIVKNTILLDDRIGRNIDVPGPDGELGFGGKCFPKDLNALIYLARENYYRPYLFEEVWRLNERLRKNKDWEKIPGATEDCKFN